MPRVTQVNKARPAKSNRICQRCRHKICVGETFYWFSAFMGNAGIVKYFCAQHPPKPSETTSSDKLSQLYGAREALQEFVSVTLMQESNAEHALEVLREAIDTAESVAGEYQESFDNMEANFSSGCPLMDELEEKIAHCEAWAEALEAAAHAVEYLECPSPEEAASEAYLSEIESWKNQVQEHITEAIEALEL